MSIIFSEQVKLSTEQHKDKLTKRELSIVQDYYGIGKKGRHTLEELGKEHGVTRERVRQIKFVALSKLNLNPKSDEKRNNKK